MTPNDLDQYLRVLTSHQVGQAVVRLPCGTEINVLFVPNIPERVGKDPTPGGWKTMQHLDDPMALREDLEYRGELP